MKKKEFNEKMYFVGISDMMKKKYPNDEEVINKKRTEELVEQCRRKVLKINLCNKLLEVCGYHEGEAWYRAEQIVDRLPEELHQNIDEYIDGKELSDIYYKDLTINNIMNGDKFDLGVHHFVQSCLAMAYFVRSGYESGEVCIRYFTTM